MVYQIIRKEGEYRMKKSQSSGRHSSGKDTKQSNGKNKIFIITIILVLLLVIGAMAFVIVNLLDEDDSEDKRGSSGTPKRDTVITMDNKDEILADLKNKVMDGLFEARMSVDWTFENSSSPSKDAYVANVPANSRTIYFDVTLDGTGETVYESPYIPVGSELKNITLKSNLSAGTYPATLTYHLIDDNYNDVSKTAVTVTIKVKN